MRLFLPSLAAVCVVALAAPAFADEFTYESLVALIKDKNLDSIEKTLPELPQEMRSNYLLMKESRSLQAADPLNPRVILFTKNAKLSCTFNGREGTSGYDSLECYQYRDTESAFDFRHILFPTPENGLTEVAFSERNRTADGKISCVGCHASDPRPNWASYQTWPGAFGEYDDIIHAGNEEREYAAFVGLRPTHPRYKWLVQENDPSAPFVDGRRGMPIERRPNLRFSEFVGRLNARRAERILASRQRPFEVAAFGFGALGCELSPEGQEAAEKVGLDSQPAQWPATIFARLGMRPNHWSTAIFDDVNQPGNGFDHQSGYGFLATSVGMATLDRYAKAGDRDLQDAFQRVERNTSAIYQGTLREFFGIANALLPDPDRFGRLDDNKQVLCPPFARILTSELEAEALAARLRAPQ